MRIAAALLLLSLGAVVNTTPAPVAPERVRVRISTLGDTRWATTGLLIGNADVYPESVVVTFDSTYITQIAHDPTRSRYHLDSMTVSLAKTSGRNVDVSAESAALTIADSLAERVAFSLGKVRFRIPRPPEQSIRDSWLVVKFYHVVAPSLVPREQQEVDATVAPSARGIFSRVTVPADTMSALALPAQVPVRISSLETGFVTKGAFFGTAHVYPESVVVAFDSTHVTQLEYQGRSSYHLDSMTVSLATGRSDGRWERYATSAALTIVDSLAERVTFSLGKAQFRIPRPPLGSLRNSRLVVTFYQINSLVPREQQGASATYAHSAGIFSRLYGR